MSLPREIIPNPLVTSAVEIRFVSDVTKNQLLSKVFPLFGNELPNLSEGNIPQEFKMNDDSLKYSPDYILSNDKYSMSFSTNMVSFENIEVYQLWGNYFEFIKRQLSILNQIGLVKSIQRIGVRYASIFPGIKHPSECFSVFPTVANDNIKLESEKLLSFTASYFNEKAATLYLQIYPSVIATRNNENKVGFMIDIDSFNTEHHDKIDESLFTIIDTLHTKEKDFLFNQLLSANFLKSLNVTY